jgi:NADH-quinone oxidoreductase subunit N
MYSYPQLIKLGGSCSVFIFLTLFSIMHSNGISFQQFDNLLTCNASTWLFQNLLLVSIISCICFCRDFYTIKQIFFYEYDFLISFALIGFLILLSVNDFSVLYLSIELQSLSLYVLSIFHRSSEFSNESGVKYFILGSFSSCILLLGIALIYLCFGSLNFNALAKISTFSFEFMDISFFGLFLIFCAILFKLGVVPFHM